MKKLLRTFVLMALLLPFAMQAQVLTVCDGTVSNEYVPFQGWNADSPQHNQMIYPATDLASMTGQTILQMVFYIDQNASNGSNTAADRLGTWTVSLGETTETTLDGLDNTTSLTQVYQGYFDCSTGTLTLEFDIPYMYNGGNLLVDINHAAASWNRWYFLGIEATGASYTYNNQRNFLPKCSFTYGDAPSCFRVSDVAINATQTTNNSLTLTWADEQNTGATYDIYDMSDTSIVASGVSGLTYTVTGLTANTPYTFGIQTNCGGGDIANGFSTVNGRTACDVIATLPYTMGFESEDLQGTTGELLFPFCWTRINTLASGSNTYYPYAYNYGTPTHTGSYHLYFSAASYGTYADTTGFIMPELDVTTYPMNANRVTFWARVSSTSPYNVIVGTMSDPADMSTFSTVETVTVNNTIYTKYSVSLAEANANDAYVAFIVPKVNSSMYIDDVTLEVEPNCPDITGLTLDSQTASGANISWNDNGASSYEVEVRQNNTVLNDITVVVTDTTAEISGLEIDNDYQIVVRAICGSETGSWSEAVNVHIGFCLPNPTSIDNSGITSVSFGGMTNSTTHPAAAPYYGNYADMSGTVPAGLPTDIEITYATGYTYGTIIWVDWNNNLTFDDDEVVYRGTSTNSNPTVLTATINIPTSAANGTYRMRIAGADSYFDTYVNDPTSNPSPCFSSAYSIAEDYTLIVSDIPSCTPVENLTVSNITADGATLSWDGNASSYTIYNMSDSSEVATVDNETYTLSLDPMTPYSFGVVSNCGSDQSIMMTVSFTTACTAIALPYTETFEATSATRDCWALISNNTTNVGGNYGMGFYTVDNRETVRFSSYNSASDYNQYGFSPLMEVSSEATNLNVNITYATYNSNNILNFGYVTATDTVWDPTDYTTTSSSDWQTYTAVIPATATKLAVHYYGNYSYYAWIDSVNVTELSGDYCYAITNLAVDSVTATSAFLSWSDENNSGVTYTIYNMADNTVIASNVSSTNYEVTGLTASTGYTFGVVANCSADDQSSIVTVSTFTDCENGGCLITIIGADSYGDGWSGNAIDIIQAGVTVGHFTISSGYNNTESYTVCSNIPVSFSWTIGSYPAEASFEIHDGNNTTVYTVANGSDLSSGVFFTLNNACPTCVPPAVTVGDVDINSVTINWTGTADSYDLYQDGTFVGNVTTNTYTFNGLAESTNYTFGIQAICSATDSSTMVFVNVKTTCPDVTALPYYEGFENDLGCWTTINASNDGQPWFAYNCAAISNVNPHGGAYVASSWSWNSSAMHADAWLISPKFDLPSTTDSLSFSWFDITASAYPDKYSVVLSTSTNDTAAFTTVLRAYGPATGTWTMQTVDLTPYAGQSVYIAFHHVDYDENYLFIDDIALYQGAYIPPAPDTLTVTFAVNDATMGTTVPAPGTYQYISGDTVNFHPEANAGYHFTNWVFSHGSETETLPSDYVSLYFSANAFMSYGSVTLTAFFEADSTPVTESLTIHLTSNNPALGSITPAPGTYVVALNDSLVVSATPNAGANFDGWKILVDGQAMGTIPFTPFTIPVNMNNIIFGEMTVMAMFSDSTSAPDSMTVIINTADATMGTTNPAPGTYHFAVGNTSIVTAVPNEGYHLIYWVESMSIGAVSFADTLYADTMIVEVLPIMAGIVSNLTAHFEADSTPLEPCVTPTNLHASEFSDSSITIGWNTNGNATSWNIRYRVGTGEWTTVHATTNTYVLNGLQPVTVYEIEVQADCGNGNLSGWSEPIHISTTGIENWLKNSVSLYPNPAKEYIDIRVDGDLNVKMMEVYDVYGKLINTVNVIENPTRINVNGLADGMYFVRVTTDNGVVTKPFVKK